MAISLITAASQGGAPCFSAYQNAVQSLTSTPAKVQLQAKFFDTANAFDNTTNYRFTPLVAGYYQINAGVRFGAFGNNWIALYKNGSLLVYLNQATSNAVSVPGSYLIYMNGSSDYIELWASASTTSNSSGDASTYFQAAFVRSA